MFVEIELGDAQAIVLALAKLRQERPGWDFYLHEIAENIGAEESFSKFCDLYPIPDPPKPTTRTTRRLFIPPNV